MALMQALFWSWLGDWRHDPYVGGCEDLAGGWCVLAGQAIFMDDTTVKLLQKGKGKGRNKTKTARLWIYARDEKPWGSTSPDLPPETSLTLM